jgi:ribosome biogenesis GTPase
MDLKLLGYNEFFSRQFDELAKDGYTAARVAVPNKTNYTLLSESGELTGELSGKFYFDNDENKDAYPVVGDWVAVRAYPEDKIALIDVVLKRKTKFSRKSAGVVTEEQILAANVDSIFVMTSVNHDINPRRLERYLTVIKESDIEPVVIFSKSDLIENKDEILEGLTDVLQNTGFHFISNLTGEGLEELKVHFKNNSTVALTGSSGVGKTTLINNLLPGIDLRVAEIGKYKDKGKHTTTRRELYLLPDGGLIIDNPGIRELQLWDGSDGIGESFPEIEKLVIECKFTDCKHESEPGCAVKLALENGDVSKERYNSYIKLQKEINYFQTKSDIKAALDKKKKWKKISVKAKEIIKNKYLKK